MLTTVERLWLIDLISGAESGDFGVDIPTRINAPALRKRLKPTPTSVMREALLDIRDRQPDGTDTGSPVGPYPHEMAAAALTVADQLESEA